MSDHNLVFALRHRLGLYPRQSLTAYAHMRCLLCDGAMPQHDHFHSCRPLRGSIVTDRHNAMLKVLATLTREAHCNFWLEPRIVAPGGRRRPRQASRHPPRLHHVTRIHRSMLDVSVTNPTSPSYLRPGNERHCRDVELLKVHKYRDLALADGCEFVPFVMESYGTWGQQAVHFLRELAASHSNDPEAAAAFYRRSVAACSFALQAGNPHVASMGSLRHRTEEVHAARRDLSRARL